MTETQADHYLNLPIDPPMCVRMESRDLCLTMAIFSQAKFAGFEKPDARVWKCPDCQADGFNTGMGVITFTCGMEAFGEPIDVPCGGEER